MKFNKSTAAAASAGFQQGFEPAFNKLWEEADRAQKKKERGDQLRSGYESLFPALSEDQVNGVANLALAGAPIPQGILDQAMNKKFTDDVLGRLPHEVAVQIQNMPPAYRKKALADLSAEQVSAYMQKTQRESDINELVDLKNNLDRLPDGSVDWENGNPEKLIKWGTKLQEVWPHTGDKGMNAVRNMIAFGQFASPGEVGKAPKDATGYTADERALIDALGSPQYDNWDNIPEPTKFFIHEKLNVKGKEDWEEWRGIRPIADKAISLTTSVINGETKSLLPGFMDFGMALASWTSGGLDPKTDKNGVTTDPHKKLREHLEENYVYGLPQIRQKVLWKRSEEFNLLCDALNENLSIKGPAKQVHRDLINLYLQFHGAWEPSITDSLTNRGYRIDDINWFKEAFQAINEGYMGELTERLKGNSNAGSGK